MSNRYRHAFLAAAAVLALSLSACGGGSSSAGSTTAEAAPSSSVPFDRAFIDAMVPHHRAAIEMAVAAEKAGLSQPALIGVATNIVDSQQLQIDEMLAWRKQWFGSSKVDPKGASALGLSMDEMGMSHGAGEIAKADDVDSAFASMMIDHHTGAIAMAKLALAKAEHPELKTLARQIIADQKQEIARMKPHAGGMKHTGGGMKGMGH